MKISPYLYVLALIIVCSLERGHGAVQFADPPSGEVIADFEGVENFTTIMCNVTAASGGPATTRWGIENFRGVPTLQNILGNFEPTLFLISGDLINQNSLQNRLTVLRLAPELDGTILYCGTGALPQQANFPIRIYRPPSLQDNVIYRIEENSLNVPVDLSEDPAAFPIPTDFSWTRDNSPLNDASLTYSTITFPSISRSNSGDYAVSATNFLLDNDTVQVGSDMGSFTLDVIYGPTFAEPGPLQRYALLNESLSLVCGTGLDSNPNAVIAWMAPDGTTIVDNARYDLENGPGIVRLNFTHTILSDNGIWRCDVRVISDQDVVSNGSLIRQDLNVIGTPIIRDIQLTIIAIPGQPQTLSVDRVEATSIRICWEPPQMADSPITFYSIKANNLNATGGMDTTVVRNTTTNATFFTVPDLLPGTTYELTVVAVSRGGDVVAVSEPSDPQTATTDVTAPAPTCTSIRSADGVITVMWSYIHRGGLPLTSVSVVYRFEEGLAMSPPTDVDIANEDVTTAMVMNLIAGRLYTFTVTAENSNGSASIDCGPVRHDVGIPAVPSFGELTPGPDPGQVSIQIKTVASGVSDPAAQEFAFVIVPVLGTTPGEGIRFPLPDYQSNMFETIIVRNLMPGQSYTFSATAVSDFGTSVPENSAPVQAAGTRPPTQPPSAPPQTGNSNIGAAVGGAIGGIAVVALIVLIVIVIVLLFTRRGGKTYRPNKAESDVRYQPAPTSESTTQVKEASPDIGEPMHKDAEIQYAELDTFRPPSQQQKNGGTQTEPKPVEPEEPVEYAIITNFKKKEGDPPPAIIETSAVPDPTPDTTTSEGDADKTGTSTTLV